MQSLRRFVFALACFAISAAVNAENRLRVEDACSLNETADAGQRGACWFVNPQKGFCIHCHALSEDTIAQNEIGPSLNAINTRYPDGSILRALIWDPTIGNPHSVMPPYGRHAILSEREIDDLIAFLNTL